jgi:glycogen operon protein
LPVHGSANKDVCLAPAQFITSRGRCTPLGATPIASGVNFAVFSRHAERINLVLFEPHHDEPIAEIALDPAVHRTGDVWHILVHDLPTHVLYGYRVSGPNNPRTGHRFNDQVVVIDPYARAISGAGKWAMPDRPAGSAAGYSRTKGRVVRLGRIVDDDFDWEGDTPPRISLSHSVIYEMHVRGFTRHRSAGVKHPGTFMGVCEKIPYLKSLGVTAVQLMPVLEFDELDIIQRHPVTGEVLTNFWGYSPISFFAPKASYAADPQNVVGEFKEMVKALHRENIEVILDVVYNHTAEGNEQGPTLCFRGLDNATYYLLDREGRYCNYSGCGNTVNCNQPVVHQLIVDSLAYLVSEYHVDGFRFDLASILGRGPSGSMLDDPPLLRHISEHPVLGAAKLLAEPWDAAGSSQLGKFSSFGRWTELNGAYRDDVRRFIRGEASTTAGMAKRLCGSLDLYPDSMHRPGRSINFVTCHDGFTLQDLVSYNSKHNWNNGESNRDGWDHNFSFNGGHEGPTNDPHIRALRRRQMRNFMAVLLMSQGVPCLLHGDEFGRTQNGNNNAYCQDNEVSWVDWDLSYENEDLVRFTRMMIALRKRHFMLRPDEFVNRVSWHGAIPGEPDWTGQHRQLAFQVHGHGQPDFYVMLNAHWESQRFRLPCPGRWKRLIDTNLPSPHDIVEEKDAVHLNPGDHYIVSPRSVVALMS